MTYSLRYKLQGQLFWRRIKGVTFNFIENGIWVIVFSDGSQMVLPVTAAIKAEPDRHAKYKMDAEREAGQPIATNPGGNA